MLTRAVFGLALAAVSMLGPARAAADPGSDFLSQLNWYGIDLSALMGHPISTHDAIELGQDICGDLHRGKPVATESNLLYREMPRITDKQAANLVSAAQFAICPDTM